MSKALTAPHTDEAIRWLTSELQSCAKKVLDRTFGADTFVISASEQATAAVEPSEYLWAAHEFTPGLGHAGFGLDSAAALELGHRLLRAKGRASEHDHHAVHAMNHVIGQIAAELAAKMASRLNAAVESADLPDNGDPDSFAHTVSLALAEPNGDSHLLLIRVSGELLAALSISASDSNRYSAPATASSLRNLDVLLDVEMPVSISFGATRIPLKEVAKLNSGSTLELNRPLSEPIQIVVNNCSIARGEVIVVDGKFAVRIQDIISRQDRLRSLT